MSQHDDHCRPAFWRGGSWRIEWISGPVVHMRDDNNRHCEVNTAATYWPAFIHARVAQLRAEFPGELP